MAAVAASSLLDEGYAEIVCGRGAEKVLETTEQSRIGDDDELILFRVPPGFDAAALAGVELCMDADETVVGEHGRYAMRPVPQCETACMLAAFPSREQGRWVTSRPFTAQFSVVMRPPGAADRLPAGPPELPAVPQLQGLRLRHPFKGGQLSPRRPPSVTAVAGSGGGGATGLPGPVVGTEGTGKKSKEGRSDKKERKRAGPAEEQGGEASREKKKKKKKEKEKEKEKEKAENPKS
jgi:hypothetical protein